MKKALAILGQLVLFFLFLAVFFSGSLLAVFHLDPFHAQWFVSHPTPTSIRYFLPTGLIYMTLLYLIVFAIEAAMKRLRTAGLWTTIVYILALVIGLRVQVRLRHPRPLLKPTAQCVISEGNLRLLQHLPLSVSALPLIVILSAGTHGFS